MGARSVAMQSKICEVRTVRATRIRVSSISESIWGRAPCFEKLPSVPIVVSPEKTAIQLGSRTEALNLKP